MTVRRPTGGCAFALAWCTLVPLAVVLIADGHGDWIATALGVGAFAVILVVLVGEAWPSRWRR